MKANVVVVVVAAAAISIGHEIEYDGGEKDCGEARSSR